MNSHFKYIEWRDTSGLHQDTLHSLSELHFLKDELRFLEDLVEEHTLQLFYGKDQIENKSILNQLDNHSKRLLILLKELEAHKNKLQVLMDNNDVLGELREYKDEHYKLLLEEMDFHSDVKNTKRTIFEILSVLIKKNKQKKLL
ncbi:hypothetical protein [Constantimarinum furrinae]|uniref:Uncharacterized protein n=1 Tax=Constantimarinum furrinae TaxID=2562285 RepID=A0A7G8PXL5_9FLAO|nr:hypothetical protein [Constantimarinum furrinae]QNJ99081.1 hypothetical protein ALE3EI_2548 [Constantimarinum furrinae]